MSVAREADTNRRMNFERPIAYYTTNHGYGHGARTCDILRAFGELYPEITIDLVTGLPDSFLANRLTNVSYRLRDRSFDVGMAQKDSVRVDVAETLARLDALETRREHLLAAERDFLRAQHAAMVVADIPGMPLRAASDIGIPAVAVANFSSDSGSGLNFKLFQAFP